VFKRVAQTFGTRLSTALINFLIVVAVSRFLGVEGKGEQGIIITTIALILLFSNMLGGASLVYLASRYQTRQLLLPSYIWSILVGLTWGLVLYFTKLVPQEYALHLALLSVINSWASVNINVLVGKEQIGKSNLVNLLQSLVVIIVFTAVVLGAGQRDIYAYLWALYASYCCMFVMSILFAAPYIRNTSSTTAAPYKSIIRDLFVFGFMNQLAHIAQLLSFRLSYYLLESFSGLKSVGIYSNGVSLMEAVWMISGSIALVQYSKIANSSDKIYAQQLTARMTRYGLWASLFVIVPLTLLPSTFWVLLFGPGFSEVNQVMWYLAPGVFIFNYALVTGHYFSGTGKYYVNAIASAAGLLVTLALAIWLIPILSFRGAALTGSISYFITSGIVFLWFIKESGLSPKQLIPLFRDLKEMFQLFKETLTSLKTSDRHGKDQ
jgi:O-antigen/teichoic acid export membrane protein